MKSSVKKKTKILREEAIKEKKDWEFELGGIIVFEENGHGLVAAEYDDSNYGAKFEKAKIACDNLNLNGHEDWYLPSVEELKLLHLKKSEIGTFTDNSYWSSTLTRTYKAWVIDFKTGDQAYGKGNGFHYRCVRKF
jgi:hypothetical protein